MLHNLGRNAADSNFSFKHARTTLSFPAAAARDAQTTAPEQRLKPRPHVPTEPLQLQSVSSHAATSAKSRSSAGHQQQSAADVAAAAGIVAATAALQVVQSATEEVQAELQVRRLHP